MEQVPDDVLFREAMRRISHRRKREARPCTVCGAEMVNSLPHRRYCSGACRARAYYARNADAIHERRARRAQEPNDAS